MSVFRGNQKKRSEKAAAFYGKKPSAFVSEERREKIAAYFRALQSEERFSLDDITWHDLHLDDIFDGMNRTVSSLGEDRLYQMLREPLTKEGSGLDSLSERKRVLRLFDSREDIRTRLLSSYYLLGKTKKIAPITLFSEIDSLKEKPPFAYAYHALLLPLAFASLFLSVPLGLFFIIGVIVFNVYTYNREKSTIRDSYGAVGYFARMVQAAAEIGQMNCEELNSYGEEIRREVKPLLPLRRRLFFIGEGKDNTLSLSLLDALFDYIRMMTHVDFIAFHSMVRVLKENRETVLSLMKTLGTLEALVSVSSYRRDLWYFTEGNVGEVCSGDTPETAFDGTKIRDEGNGKGKSVATIRITEGYHPLTRHPVPNSLTTDSPVLLTGSNASGKSTFLRMVGLLTVLSESVVTVPAKEYTAPFAALYSSMSLSDDIRKEESYFMKEIRSVKRIFDAPDDVLIIGLIDEVLRGTNTIERIASSAQILKAAKNRGILLFAATHDGELTGLLKEDFINYHFEEEMNGKDIHFSYQLQPGPATTRNAISLLKNLGYAEIITEKAEEMAQQFETTGQWEMK